LPAHTHMLANADTQVAKPEKGKKCEIEKLEAARGLRWGTGGGGGGTKG